MQHFLPRGLANSVNPMLSSFSKKIRIFILTTGLILAFSLEVNAQDPIVIQNWTSLPEAEFHFDTAFAVVKCTEDSQPLILLEVFNEAGNVDAIAFELIIGDKDRNQATVNIPKFDIAPSKFIRPKCGESETSHLQISAPEGIDGESMFIYKIKYIK